MDDSVYEYDEIDVLGKSKIKKREATQYKKTSGFLSKTAFFFGLSLLIISIVIRSFSFTDKSSDLYSLSVSSIPGSIFSISIILLAVAAIMYFFEYQFAKLEKIVEEIENCEEYIVDESAEEKI